jgi:hypothetical protein
MFQQTFVKIELNIITSADNVVRKELFIPECEKGALVIQESIAHHVNINDN